MTLLSSSLKGTSYLIALQATSRILTFTLNQLILQYTTPSIFGFATIQLELLLNTILFLCREGFRISVQRLPVDEKQGKTQEIVNLSYIPVSAGFFIATSLSALYTSRAPSESAATPYFRSTVLIYGLSTIIELFSEPGYNIALHQLLFRVRASCEGTAVLVRCFVTFAMTVYGGQRLGALSFALGQLFYSITLLLSYRYSISASFAPKRISSDKWISDGLLRLSFANTAQGLLKHVLTEGDKFMISWFSTNEEQGSYGLAANYGGLVARILLQPIEEASRSYFSNILPAARVQQEPTRKELDSAQKNKRTAKLVLVTILRVYILASALLMSFAPSVINTVLSVWLNGSKWRTITPVLSAYCYYIPLLAINGILESFVTATASPATLQNQGLWWIPFSFVFGVAGYLFRGYGASGLVYANCVNLSLRIIWAACYMKMVFGDLNISSVSPSIISCTAVVGVAGFVMTLEQGELVPYLVRLVPGLLVAGVMVIYGEWSWAVKTYQTLKS